VLDRVVELSEADRQALRALSEAVYPPGSSSSWPGRQIEWSPAEWCVRIHDDEGTLVSYVGVVLRDAEREGQPVRVGGIGGVKTHPAARRRGLAGIGLRRAIEFFHHEHVDFGLLVCGPHLLDYYGKLGWREFDGRLLIRQHGAAAEFTFNRVMTYGVRSAPPTGGTVDLLGPPW
jgi:hypothetical protein